MRTAIFLSALVVSKAITGKGLMGSEQLCAMLMMGLFIFTDVFDFMKTHFPDPK